ncbi:hypothetical protein HMPREF0530_1324 [Lacticaseibacillus paracasei subsp. paracasei ATCC 25302 = DSM 5622 = JCM 8130]|nr:hypothetical protein HMPREF0530_1324 [Lacticaseibacillus paracasei subsp. paracasei ATCC 25302 = DSM 5622 = JCM 8130]
MASHRFSKQLLDRALIWKLLSRPDPAAKEWAELELYEYARILQ